MTYASIRSNALPYARAGAPKPSRYGLMPPPGMAFDIQHETQAIRGALFGVALSVPIWAVTLAFAYWLLG